MMTLTFTQFLAFALALFVLGCGLALAAIAYAFGGEERGAGCMAMVVTGGTLLFSGACFYLALAPGF